MARERVTLTFCQSLEDVFLRLCERDQPHDDGVSSATDHLQNVAQVSMYVFF